MKKILKKIGSLITKTMLPYYIYSYFRQSYYESKYNRFFNEYEISKDFKFNGIDIEFYGKGRIVIGSNSYIGNRSVIQSTEGCEVLIGDNCSISHNVRIYTLNRNSNDIIECSNCSRYRKGNVLIGDNTWIGANVFIVEGVEIGNNCVIGANSVVTKSIPSFTVAAGLPARIIKK